MTDKQLSHDLSGRFGVDQALRLNTLDFISQHGSVLDALMYSRLLWPEFVEIDDMIFLKRFKFFNKSARVSAGAQAIFNRKRCKPPELKIACDEFETAP
jgi:hypothetical protein